jgi:hypothetical protein
MNPKFLRFLAPFLSVAALAQAPPRTRFSAHPYFPLAVGNEWAYVQRGRVAGEPVTFQIIATNQFNSISYYQITGYAEQPAWVRYNTAGELVEYDPSGRTEKLWYPFGGPDGFSFRSQLSAPCLQNAVLRARNAEIRVPAGTFSPFLAVEYQPGPCADAGYSEEVFVVGIGLVRRTAITIAGPRSFELIWARVNGTVISGPELSFSVALDKPLYYADFMPPVDPARSIPVLTARLTTRNTGPQPLILQFNSGQRYDLVIRDSKGDQIYQWSQGKFFTQALGRLELKGEQIYFLEIPLADRAGRTYPEGRYTLEAWLATSEGKAYAATVPFEIQYVR